MENNLFNYLLIPEIFFTILILVLILIGLYKKNNSFSLLKTGNKNTMSIEDIEDNKKKIDCIL